MSREDTPQQPEETPEPMPWVDFLQAHPPGSTIPVTEASTWSTNLNSYELNTPELQLFCPQDTCNAYMFFTTSPSSHRLYENQRTLLYLTYVCRNCRKYWKTFSLAVQIFSHTLAEGYKFGEFPHFGPPVPPRVLRLIQPDRELFLSGRRCENQGLGIGAFTYYRRVVENQWSRLVGEIIKVAKAIKASETHLAALEDAKNEQQFTKSVKNLKDAIPPALLINGHNPLVLLHGSLSQGVHNLPDEECLSLATSIRVVLVELAEKLGQALKDEQELTNAVSKLLQTQTTKQLEVKESNNALEEASDSARKAPSEAPQG